MTFTNFDVLPGDGTVCRRGSVAVWIGQDVPADLARQVLAAVTRSPTGGELPAGAILADTRGLLAGVRPATIGSMALVALSGSTATALVHGATVVQNARGEARCGALLDDVIEFSLPLDGRLAVWGTHRPGDARTAGTGEIRFDHDLKEGTVRGGGIAARTADGPVPTSELAASIAHPAPSPKAFSPDEPASPLRPSGAELAAEQSGLVAGVRSANGHFNHWDAPYCRQCGIGMIQASRLSVLDNRPVVGVLVGSDGSTYVLDGDYVLGRIVESERDTRTIVLDDEGVSLRHAVISFAEWDVTITDLGSSSGTYVKNPSAGDWVRTEPHEPTVVQSAGQIRVGDQVLIYESFGRR